MALQAPSINITGQLGALSQIGKVFGLNEWELQTASFDGVSFFLVPSKLNIIPGYSVYKNVSNYISSLKGTSKNDNNDLSSDTKLALNSISSSQTNKIAVYQLPNYDGFIINNQGSNGRIYNIDAIFIGDDYLTALNNFRKVVNIQKSDGASFVHPVDGILDNCYCLNLVETFKNDKWKAVVVSFQIIQKGTMNIVTPASSTFSKILKGISVALSTIQGIITAINNAVNLINQAISLFNQLIGNNNNITPKQAQQNISSNLQKNSQQLNSITTLVYQQASPKGVTNYTFANQDVDYNNLPPMYRYSTLNTSQFNGLLQYYEDSIQNTINLYSQYGLDVIRSNDIFLLKNSLVQLDSLLKNILSQIEQTYTTYTVPFNMSIRMLFFLNGLDFNNINLTKTFINNNINNISDVNYILQNTVVTLPKG